MDEPIIPVSMTDTFIFDCHSGMSCFNTCCRDLNQYLTPYDILRAKQYLGLTSAEFLSRYTRSHTGQESGLPVVTLKTDPASGFQCPFVQPEGCLIYESRPASCRLYPLARALSRSRETGALTEQYFLIREPHCRGFEAGRTWTVAKWIEDQEVSPYNEMNDRMMEIISLKNRLLPGPLDLKSSQMFHLACYDTDGFRAELLERGNLVDLDSLPADLRQQLRTDDIALLNFAMDWIKETLFAPSAGKEQA
jgi:hypothetical protein